MVDSAKLITVGEFNESSVSRAIGILASGPRSGLDTRTMMKGRGGRDV